MTGNSSQITDRSSAFLFDLNGTIIDDMEFHIKAWTRLLNEDLKANMDFAAVKAQMYGKNTELFERVFGVGHFSDAVMEEMSFKKEHIYQEIYLPHLQLMPGLRSFLDETASLEIPMAIGSAAIPFNINFVLDNLNLHKYFSAIVSADDVTLSKPHPETYLLCAQQLNMPAENCIVFEDAPKGVEAAQNAGMKAVVVLANLHSEGEFSSYHNIIRFIRSYDEINPLLLK